MYGVPLPYSVRNHFCYQQCSVSVLNMARCGWKGRNGLSLSHSYIVLLLAPQPISGRQWHCPQQVHVFSLPGRLVRRSITGAPGSGWRTRLQSAAHCSLAARHWHWQQLLHRLTDYLDTAILTCPRPFLPRRFSARVPSRESCLQWSRRPSVARACLSALPPFAPPSPSHTPLHPAS